MANTENYAQLAAHDCGRETPGKWVEYAREGCLVHCFLFLLDFNLDFACGGPMILQTENILSSHNLYDM
jgi:hypothetical protein